MATGYILKLPDNAVSSFDTVVWGAMLTSSRVNICCGTDPEEHEPWCLHGSTHLLCAKSTGLGQARELGESSAKLNDSS